MLPLSRRRVGRKRLKTASLLVIFLSMFFPVYMGSDMRGFQALVLGWMAFFTGDEIAGITWISGPLTFLTLAISPGKRSIRKNLSAVAVIVGLLGLIITRLPMDDNGNFVNVMPGIGYVIYMLGIIGIFIYHLERWKSRKR